MFVFNFVLQGNTVDIKTGLPNPPYFSGISVSHSCLPPSYIFRLQGLSTISTEYNSMFPRQKLPALSPKREAGEFSGEPTTLCLGWGLLQEREARIWGDRLKMWGRSCRTLAQRWLHHEARGQAEAADAMGETEEEGWMVSGAANEGSWWPRDGREAGTAWKGRRLEVLSLLKPLQGCFLHP